jgi:hypothetical protein
MAGNISDLGRLSYSSKEEINLNKELYALLKASPIPDDELLDNLGLYLNPKTLSRLLLLDHLYKQMLPTMGIIIDFGTRWGQNISVWNTLRGIYEPYNRHRKIVGFDTFEGFISLHANDGKSNLMKKGGLSVSKEYEKYLENLLNIQEQSNPISHIKKFELIKGDATITFEKYLKDNPHTIISLAYFDFDVYSPTKTCLDLLKDRIVKGSVVAFDELNDQDSPGETIALMESFGLKNIKLQKFNYASRVSYFIVK